MSADPPVDVPAFRRALLRWYRAHGRDLPWRATPDAYRIWVSEIMLQQTRVAAVLEHYARFLRRFPDVSTLARATENSVLAVWSGLGYYRRARLMHACARKIVANHQGVFPATTEELRRLPGIGRYTAAAIASIAFGHPCAVVDGNVERVLTRVLGRSCAPRELWLMAQALLSRRCPGDFNQAMMELGATVCLPRAPHCPGCPVRRCCLTRGQLAPVPNAVHRKRVIRHALHTNGRRLLLVRRPLLHSLMPGMWELPLAAAGDQELLLRARHSITSTDYEVHVMRGSNPTHPGGRWVPWARAARLPLTGLTRKILRRLGLIE